MPDIAGNSLGTATSLSLTSNVQTLPDIVTSTANDYYRFTLSHRSSFNLSLASLSADVNVALLSTTGSVLSVNGTLQTSNNTGNLAESINTTLDVGTYYIRVAPGASSTSANYSLNISATSDLKTDILWRNYATGEDVVWQVAGASVQAYASLQPVGDRNWAIQGAGDFNHDGQSDLLWRNYSTGQNVIWLMNGTTYSTDVYLRPVGDPNWKINGTGDFNNDGQIDLLWRNYSTGQNVIWLMNGTTYSTDVYLQAVGDSNWQISGTGDFNNDGKTDLLWRNYSTGQNVTWLMNGTTYSTDAYLQAVGDPNWRISGTGDFNSDGKTDLLWRNYSTGQNVIWLLNGTTYSTDVYLQAVGDPNWRSLSPFTRTVEPTPISLAGNALANAFNIGSNLTGNGTYHNTVSSLNSDYYQLNVGTPSAVNLTLTGLTDNLDVQLVSSSNQVLQSSTLGNTSAETINSTLNAGTYYVRVYAANGGSSAYALNLLINNLPVVVTNAGLTLDEGTTTSISSSLLQVTDNDNPMTQLTYTLGSLPGHGALSLNGAAIGVGATFTQIDINTNQLRYQHDGTETLTDSFSFAVSDSAGGAIAGNTFSITVNPVNDAPILTIPVGQTVDQNANSLIAGISIADVDAGTGNETITISAANGLVSLGLTTGLTFAQGTGNPATSITASGTLSAINNALTSLIYRSNASFQGTETISLLVNDNGNTGKGGALTDSKTIAVTVNPVNKPPAVTLPASQSVNEDTSLSLAGISIGDVDAGGGNETVSLSAVNGVLSFGATAGLTFLTGTGSKDRNVTVSGTLALINAALQSLTYQGNKDFNGSDSVTISVNDNGNTGNGVALSDTKSLQVTVTPVNDAPLLVIPAAQSVNENTSLQVTGISINDVDAGGGAMTVSLAVASGKLSLGSIAGLSFTSGNGSPNASLIFSGTLAAINSALSTLTYQGNANFSGTDSISINVNDNGNTGFGIPLSDSKTIAVTVLGVNQAPVIQVPLAPSTIANTNLAIAGISISDPDGAGNNETVTIAAANGVLSLPSNTGLTFLQGTGNQNNRVTFRGTLAAINTAIGNLVYRSYPGFTGFDTIVISVNDEGNTGIGTALSDTKTLFVNVGGAVNTPPTANADSYSTTRNTALTITGQGVLTNDTDPENNALTANLLTTPTKGTVVFNSNGTFIYTPNANYVGNDSFTYRASDGIGNSSPATVSFSVTAPTNQAPIAVGEAFTLSQNSSFTTGNVLTNDSDPDNNTPLSAQIVATPTHASSFTLNSNGTFTYIPTTNFSGNDSFTYVAQDALGAASNTVTVSLSVTPPVNQAPIAVGEAFTLSQNSSFTTGNVLTNDSDPDNNTPLSAQIVATPTHASSFTLNSNGTFTYIPTTNFSGNDSFTYVAQDALGAASNTVTVSLSVTAPTNQAPIAVGEAFTLSQNSSFTTGNVLTNDSDPDNNTPLSAQIVATPTHASSFTLNSNGTFTYIPTTNFSGNDSFTYVAQDALGAASNTVTVSLSVTPPVNQAPIAVGEAFTLSQNSSFTTGNVLTNDSDPDNNTPLSAQIVATPTHASSFTLNSNGTFTYIPTTNFSGNDSFTYVAQDALGAASNTATVSLSVTPPVNQVPIAVGEAFTLSQNSSFTTGNVLTNDSDPDNNTPLSAQIVATPTHASSFTLNSNGTFTYIPTTNFSGNDSFTYVAQDALGAASNTATVSFSVTAPTNQAPTAVGEAFTLSQNSSFTTGNVLTNDSDPDNNTPLSAQIVATPTHASSFTLNSNGTFTYIPTTNFSGNDSFTYVAQDALGAASNTVTVSLSVTPPVNQAPIAVADAYRAVTSTPLTVSAANGVLKNDTDVDSPTLTALLVSNPSNGSVALNGNGSFVYTPTASFNGTDTFTYKANDGALDSTPVTVTLSIFGNTAPTANPDTYAVAAGVPLTVIPFSGVLQNDSDVEGDTLTASLLTSSAGGLTLSSDGSFVYTPNVGVTSGTDTFVYQVSDGFLTSSPATVTLNIGTNAAPIAQNDTYNASAGTTLTVNQFSGVLSNDTDAQPLTASVVSGPGQGTLSLSSNGSFSYVPNASFTNGIDTFVYQASDGSLATSATVTLSVSAATAPIAQNDSYQVVAGSALSVGQTSSVLNNDSSTNGTTLIAQLVSPASQGMVVLNGDGSFTYTPNAGVTNAIDTFVYQANNGVVNSSPATVTLSIVSNARPVVVNDSYSVVTNSPLTISPTGILANDTDSDVGQTLKALLVGQPNHGSLLLRVDGSFVYTPDQGYLGVDTFTYRANDGFQDSTSLGTVSLSIAANAAPIANPDTYSVNKNNVLIKDVANGVLKNDTDAEPLTASVVNLPVQGSLVLNGDGSFTYTPNAGVTNTTDTFVYKASDGSLSTNATVTVTIKDTSAPPTAVNDTGYTVNANGALTVTAAAGVLTNDTDPDGDVLKAVSGTPPSHGTVTLNNNGSFVYVPTAGYIGNDSFTYFANDGIGSSSSPATVSIVVGGVNSPPTIAAPGGQVVFRDTDLVIQSGLSIGDPDAGANTVGVTLTAASGNLTLSTTSNLTVSGNGSQTVTLSGSLANINAALTNLVYHPVSAGFIGTDQIAIAVNDNGNTGTGGAQTTSATINVNVTNGPTLVKDLNPTQNATATGTVSASPSSLTDANGTLFFSANDGASGVELWRSDGTDAGTSLVVDLNTTPDTSASSNPGNLTVIGNTLYFTANNSFRGTELWKADLTGATVPSIVKDIKSGSGSSNPRNLVNLNGTLYFEADDGSGLVLWKTDGTTANTVKVETTPGYSQPGLLLAAGNTLYFTAGNGNQLWRINAAGTQTTLLQDIGSGAGISNLVTIGNSLFFTASDSSNGMELWRSDGTAAGTTRISDINAGIGDANPSSLVTLNGQLYFFAKNGSNVYQLWQSTASGALSPASAALPSTGLAPTSLTVVGSKLFFVVDAGTSTVSDLQLWQSNGSGASLVKSINPTGNDAVASLTNVNGSLFFTANDGSTRIWKSDGTDAGTVSVSANYTGITPHNLTAVGNRLFFTAETTTTVLVITDPNNPTVFTQITGTTGEELFVL